MNPATLLLTDDDAEMLPYLHQRDLEFIEELRHATYAELIVMRKWQAQETWRRIAIDREMAYRNGEPRPRSGE